MNINHSETPMTTENIPTQPIFDQQSKDNPLQSEMSAPVNAGFINEQSAVPAEAASPSTDSQHENWLKKHRLGLGIAGLVLAGAVSVGYSHDLNRTVDEIKSHAQLGYVFPLTEGAAWAGAGLMLLSAGHKVGNPLTIKNRLQAVRTELEDNRLYKTGWALGAIGAVGTSAVIAGGAVAVLPESSWPLAFGASAASIALSTIPFKPAKTSPNKLSGRGKER